MPQCPFIKIIKADGSLITEQMLEYHLETAFQFYVGVLLANTAAQHQGETKIFCPPSSSPSTVSGIHRVSFPLDGHLSFMWNLFSVCVLKAVYVISMWSLE